MISSNWMEFTMPSDITYHLHILARKNPVGVLFSYQNEDTCINNLEDVDDSGD